MNGKKLISIVVPMYNEEQNISLLYSQLKKVISKAVYDFEIIFIDDGSTDSSLNELKKIASSDSSVKIIEFSRNFGKEAATTAGLDVCNGDACIIIDADLQHPIEMIPEFIKKWEQGVEVVIGVRTKNKGEGLIKKVGSYLFYMTINTIAETRIVPGATDFRLIDRLVMDEFGKFTEKGRMSRALIDWLGFKRDYIYFRANERLHGESPYTILKLLKLALSTFVTHSLFPLRLAGYLGIFITFISGLLGIVMFIDTVILSEAYKLHFSGPAMLMIFTLFLVGIILICLGLIALYIGNIHLEVVNRPLYVIRSRPSNPRFPNPNSHNM